MPDIKLHNYWEHAECTFKKSAFPGNAVLEDKAFDKKRGLYCFTVSNNSEDSVSVKAHYYIGVDWLLQHHTAITIAPKLNTRYTTVITGKESEDEIDAAPKDDIEKDSGVFIDYFSMLNECLGSDFLYKETDNLIKIDWEAPEISISQEQDWLSPLLIVKFLNVLKSIIRKGLKKSYYKTVESLNSKVKGKILVGTNIKENVLKNRLTKTICQYEEFGINNMENRLLKRALEFTTLYVDNNQKLFGKGNNHFSETVNYCRPAFENVSTEVEAYQIKSFKANPFFKEYSEGIHLAKLILKRYAYTISNTSKEKITTPPYWIDMPKLFELYAYSFLKKLFPEYKQVQYQYSTYGNKLDFLVNAGQNKLVVDAKYKPVYLYGKNHDDIRQVAGYARLEKVYDALGVNSNSLIDCLIIYPDIENGYSVDDPIEDILKNKLSIKGYRNIYKLGIKLPVKQQNKHSRKPFAR